MKLTSFHRVAGLTFACFSVAFGAASPARAADALIEGGRLCTEQFPVQEKANNIPTHLLAAISTTESGRWHSGLGMAVPWPWTINVEGKGYYFKNKAEAIAQTQNLIAQGRRSIDVGCMQVNLKHHSKAFANLNDAFEPRTNVAYAAKFLHDNYAELGDWIKATAAYHSRTQVHGQRYLVDIERSWNKIVAKVAAARANQSGKPQPQSQPAPAPSTRAPAAATTIAEANAALAEARREIGRNPAKAPVVTKPDRSIPTTHNVKVVNVSNGTSSTPARDPNVLIIRGTPSAPATYNATGPVTATIATPASAPAPAPADDPLVIRPEGDSVRRVALDNAAPAAQPKETPATTPKFVFAN